MALLVAAAVVVHYRHHHQIALDLAGIGGFDNCDTRVDIPGSPLFSYIISIFDFGVGSESKTKVGRQATLKIILKN